MLAELRLFIVLAGMLILPGWALLAISGTWRQWSGLQRWIVAVGLSIAFYPILFYGLRVVAPFLTLGPYKMGTLLLAAAALTGWGLRGHWKEQLSFDWLEWAAIAIFGMTLFTRFWIIREHPYPAWSDSLHHTLLTQLTAVQGSLPRDMEPFFPIALGQYHLGLYALSATTQWLAQAPAHTALLWTAQVLNGLCGAGVYLALDRRVGRLGALVGAAVVGLLSHQPAFYVNWGRFTQVASQAILLIALVVTWEAISLWKRPWQEYKGRILWNTALAALISGAVFLLHFRVAAFYLLLVALIAAWELIQARRIRKISHILVGLAVIGTVALIFVLPVLLDALDVYLAPRTNQTVATEDEISQTVTSYYEFPLRSVPVLTGRIWLLLLAGISTIIGLLKRNKLIIGCILWVLGLYLLGNAYVLHIPILSITNMGAVLIMLYLPIGLAIGAAIEELRSLLGADRRSQADRLILALTLLACFVGSHIRVTEIEPYRHFVTPQDVKAMNWIEDNTPPDALFAVNTVFWLPKAPHGTDAGYWIPYFTGRQTTAGVMLLNLATEEYRSSIIEMSRLVEELETDNAALERLQELGVQYVYIGQIGHFAGPGLNAAQLNHTELATQVYQDDGVSIFRIKSP